MRLKRQGEMIKRLQGDRIWRFGAYAYRSILRPDRITGGELCTRVLLSMLPPQWYAGPYDPCKIPAPGTTPVTTDYCGLARSPGAGVRPISATMGRRCTLHPLPSESDTSLPDAIFESGSFSHDLALLSAQVMSVKHQWDRF